MAEVPLSWPMGKTMRITTIRHTAVHTGIKGRIQMIKKHKALIAYILVLAVFSTYVVLDTFVISRVYSSASGSGTEAAQENSGQQNEQGDVQTDGSQQDDAQQNGSAGGDSSDPSSEHSHGPGSHGDGSGGPPSGGPGHSGGSGSNDGSSHSGKPGKKPGSSNSSSDTSTADNSTGGSSSSSSGSTSSSGGTYSNGSSSGFGISAMSTKDTYSDENMTIKLSDYTVSGTQIHVAEVSGDAAAYLKTAFAQGAYGRNVTETTSDIAEGVNAILAINGDYYGAQEKGYVIRNGKLYRDTAVAGREDLVIYSDGSFEIINESEITAKELLAKGAVQTLSFGPALVENGKLSVDSDDEVGRAMASNPRTAIGIKSDGTYIFMVSDGRTDDSEGFSLLQLAEFMKYLGAETAYNLDGGGSSTMVFNGSVVNTPTGGGIGNGSGSERKVSDIVYIGY